MEPPPLGIAKTLAANTLTAAAATARLKGFRPGNLMARFPQGQISGILVGEPERQMTGQWAARLNHLNKRIESELAESLSFVVILPRKGL